MYRIDLLNGLQLHDHLLFDDDVDAEALSIQAATIRKIHESLTLGFQATHRQFPLENGFIDALEQSGAEIAMDLQGSIDHMRRDVVQWYLES